MARRKIHALEPNGIYAALAISDENQKIYHWAIYLHHGPKGHVFRVRATNSDSTGYSSTKRDRSNWTYDHEPDFDLFSLKSLVLVAKIGELDNEGDWTWIEAYLDESQIPMDFVPSSDRSTEPHFTSRVWFREAVRRLNSAGLFLNCRDVDALETELWVSAMLASSANRQDVAVYAAHSCPVTD